VSDSWEDKYPQDIQEQAIKRAIQDQYKSSLYKTCKKLLGYNDINISTHGDMVRALESTSKRKLIVMPRGTFKSSVGCVGYPIWMLMRDPNLRILIDSEKYDNSKNFIREIKGKLSSNPVINLFGEFRSDNNWAEGSITIRQRDKILKEASITASGLSANKTSQHYDVIIHDDMNSDKNSNTTESCQKIIDHYRMNTSILEPGGVMVIIGTRYSANDLIQFVMDNEINKEGLVTL
jgi:hypothetical protein